MNPNTGAPTNFPRYFHLREHGLFLQDDWKVTRRFTANLGVRHDYFGTVSEEHGLLSSIILGSGNTFDQQLASGAIGRVSRLYHPQKFNFSPRIGFAYDPFGDGKTSIRSGFGLAFQPHHGQSIAGARALAPDAAQVFIIPSQGLGNQIDYRIPVPFNPSFALGFNSAGGVGGVNGNPLIPTTGFVVNPVIKTQYSENWFLNVQREIKNGWIAEIGYVGTNGVNLERIDDVNRSSGDLLNPTHFGKALRLAILDQGGNHIAGSTRFTLSETTDQPLDWSPDGNTLIIYSNRSGASGIYRQPLRDDNPHLLVVSQIQNEARVTPDGKWVLYIPAPQPSNRATTHLMRVPFAGGEPEAITSVRPDARILCARPPSQLCAIAQPGVNHTQLILREIDSEKGAGPELARLELDPNESDWFVDLSPDGSRIALMMRPTGPISLLSLRDKTTSEIQVKHWTSLHAIHWAADGKGLFVGSGSGPGTLLYVDLLGNAKILWQHASPLLSTPSPDGRYLAIADHTMDRNLWMIENF